MGNVLNQQRREVINTSLTEKEWRVKRIEKLPTDAFRVDQRVLDKIQELCDAVNQIQGRGVLEPSWTPEHPEAVNVKCEMCGK